ncbi:MAG: glutamine--fructose-6-phosphate transaminase (isomerizing), partial [Gemmatimonadetes bacterium]|nr:glutamine--fructose-6-phosphate transaminase (isomerizing) [Gemmatimonadota bacterium]
MCGIVAYIGEREVTPLLLEGLRRLEYRGYDSAGVTVARNGTLSTAKAVGKIAELENRLNNGGDAMLGSTCGIAHTRWATHGPPTELNAHPHTGNKGEVWVVHNGIIENYGTLKKKLRELGHEFETDTDTEVVAHLIEEAYDDSLEEAVRAALSQIEGTYGLAIMSSREPGKIVGARKGSPLLVGVGEDNEYFLASDVAAVLAQTRNFIYLEDGEMVVLTREGYNIFSLKGREITKEVQHVSWDLDAIEKSGFDHFMMKEITEQPETLENTMRGRLLEEEGTAKLGGLEHLLDELKETKQIVITACGTSWHAALLGEYMLEEFARIPVEVEYASEFRYRNPILPPDTTLIAISQSGETADTLAAIREGKRQNATAMGIVNVVGSTIARETDGGVYIHAGPEIGVASTKAFTSQVVTLALFTLLMARQRGMSVLQGREIVHALRQLPDQVAQVIDMNDAIRELARIYKDAGNFLYLGRGYNFPTALEGALKLKEISYIHAEGYPAAEMKHGPIALIDDDVPVVFLAPRDSVFSKVVSNIEEVKTRGGRVIAIASDGESGLEGKAD